MVTWTFQKKIGKGFAPIRDSTGELEKVIQSDKDGSTTMQFDAVVNETLAGIKDPKERQTVSDWVAQKRQQEHRNQLINGLGPAAVSLLALFAGQYEVPLLIGAIGWGGASAFGELKRSGMGLDAAQSGDAGGERLTQTGMNEARTDYLLGFVNVALALTDAGVALKSMKGVGSSRWRNFIFYSSLQQCILTPLGLPR